MTTEATADTFAGLVAEGCVLVDFWGPRCVPCLALMPAVEKLEERLPGLRVVKVNAAENRQVCRDLRIFGLPTFVFYRDGKESSRLGSDTTAADITAAAVELMGGE
jgi:thioredoxin 1